MTITHSNLTRAAGVAEGQTNSREGSVPSARRGSTRATSSADRA